MSVQTTRVHEVYCAAHDDPALPCVSAEVTLHGALTWHTRTRDGRRAFVDAAPQPLDRAACASLSERFAELAGNVD